MMESKIIAQYEELEADIESERRADGDTIALDSLLEQTAGSVISRKYEFMCEAFL